MVGNLYAGVAAEVEVVLGGVCDDGVDGGACRDVAALADLLLLVGTEQPRVVSLLHHHERDARLVAHLQLHTRLPDRLQLVDQHLKQKHLHQTRRISPGSNPRPRVCLSKLLFTKC